METSLNITDKEVAYFSSDERKWIAKVRKLKEQRPDEVQIIREPEENDGCIYCTLPADWFKLTATRIISDEQRELLRERAMRTLVNSQNSDN